MRTCRFIPLRKLAGIVALLTLVAGLAYSQTTGAGTITGTITDPSGSVVPEAMVTVKNVDTGIERKIATNAAGLYVASFMQPGRYEIGVTKPGLSTVLRKDLTLQVGQTLTLDFSMTLQTTQEMVTVTTEAPVVDTEKTDQSQVISSAL